MSDNDGKKTLGLGGSRPSNVKQSFSHGRTKNVVVETKRKRVVVPKPGASKPAAVGATGRPIGGDPSKRPAGISDVELERRMKALAMAKAREAEEQSKREAEEKERQVEREARRAEQEAKEAEDRAREERAKQKAEEEAAKKAAAEEAKRRAAEPAAPASAAATTQDGPSGAARNASSRKATPAERERENKSGKPGRGGANDGRRSGKLTVSNAMRGGEGGRQRSMAAMKRKQDRARAKAMGVSAEREKVYREVALPEAITVSELAARMTERVADVVKALMTNGIMATQTQTIDADTAELIIEEFGHTVVRVSDADVEDVITAVEDKAEDLQPRAPIITIMGHVDHGKTSLLDAIRKTRVVAGEAGGITQHKAAKVPMIVAINKVDREAANPDKVRTDLLQHEVIVEKMSGEVQDVEVSAITGQGLDELLEAIALQAELLELKANPDRGEQWGKVRALIDDKGDRVKVAGPSVPVEVLGLNGTPEAGDVLNVTETEAQAREIAEYRANAAKDKRAAAGAATTLEQLMANAKANEDVSELPILVKALVCCLRKFVKTSSAMPTSKRSLRSRMLVRLRVVL